MVDVGTFGKLIANIVVPTAVLDAVSLAIDTVEAPLNAALGHADDIVVAMEAALTTSPSITDAAALMEGAKTELDKWELGRYLGGDGDDVIAAGSGGGKLAGGEGNDTYMFAFGTGGTHIINESAPDAVLDFADLFGVDFEELDALSTGAGGSDILERRG